MRVGSLRERITILQPQAGQDSIGQPNTGFTPLATDVPADVRYLSGLETIKGGAQAAVAQASVRIRYRTDLNTKMRVQHGATIFEITAVLPDLPRRAHVDLACKVIR